MSQFITLICENLPEKTFKAGGGVGIAIVTLLFGDITPALYAVAILILIDFISGTWRSAAQKELNSQKAIDGLAKAFLYAMVMAAAHQISHCGEIFLLISGGLVGLVAVTELISFLENFFVLSKIYNFNASWLNPIFDQLKDCQKQMSGENPKTPEPIKPDEKK